MVNVDIKARPVVSGETDKAERSTENFATHGSKAIRLFARPLKIRIVGKSGLLKYEFDKTTYKIAQTQGE